MSCPPARCSNSRPREARALWGWSRSSARSRWGGAPTSWCWTSAARISRPRLRTRCRTSCTRPRRVTCATCSWTAARWCSTASCSRCPSTRSCARRGAAPPSCGDARGSRERRGTGRPARAPGPDGRRRGAVHLLVQVLSRGRWARRAGGIHAARGPAGRPARLQDEHGRAGGALDRNRHAGRGGVRSLARHAGLRRSRDAPADPRGGVGLEATPPLGRADRWEIEPFFAFGWAPEDVVVIQGQVVASLEEGEGLTAWSYRVGAGRQIGRVVPMLELEWAVPVGGDRTLSFYPQCWVQLSRLGHVAASLGAELPAVGLEPRHPRLIAFVLWDYGDAPLFRGW